MTVHRLKAIITVLLLSNIVCVCFLLSSKKQFDAKSDAIQAEHISCQREVCTVLCGDDYDSFVESAYKYEEISRVYAYGNDLGDLGLYRAAATFLDEAYFADSSQQREIISNLIQDVENAAEADKQEMSCEVVNRAILMYNDWCAHNG